MRSPSETPRAGWLWTVPWRRWALLQLLAGGAAAVLAGSGCSFDFDRVWADKSYQCAADVVRYGTLNPEPKTQSITTPQEPAGAAHQWQHFSLADPSDPPFLYLGGPKAYLPQEIPPLLKGSYLLQINKHPYFAGETYLTVALSQPVERVWVAFVRSAPSPHPWLKAPKFQKTGVVLKSTQFQIEYDVWEMQRAFWATGAPGPVAVRFTLPGNSHQIIWPGGTPGPPYLVFVKTVQRPDTSKPPVQKWPVTIEVCVSRNEANPAQLARTEASGKRKDALETWLMAGHESYRKAAQDGFVEVLLRPTPCTQVLDSSVSPPVNKGCTLNPSTSGPLTEWPIRSEARIDPKSSFVIVERQGHAPAKSALRGRISFLITPQGRVEIGELTLFGDSFKLGDVAVGAFSFGQGRTLVADCADAVVPEPFSLCQNYEVPVGGFRGTGTFTVEGEPKAVVLENTQRLKVSVDYTTWRFTFTGGGITEDLGVKDDRVPVTIKQLEAVGLFEDFAPVASLAESETRFPCVDNRLGPVTLDASASFDPGPGGGIVGYRWVEDAGAPSETLLATGKKITVTMFLGRHDVTLFAADARGIWDRAGFQVEVYDDRIDAAEPPPDVCVEISTRAGTPVDLGQPQAADACSGVVEVTHDAPTLFPPGLTEVTWTFDDFDGNRVQEIQRVHVMPPGGCPPPRVAVFAERTLTDLPVVRWEAHSPRRRVAADAYVFVTTPVGERFSIDPQGGFATAERFVPQARELALGEEKVSQTVELPAEILVERGQYVVECILVVPGGSPNRREHLLARARLVDPLERQRAPGRHADP